MAEIYRSGYKLHTCTMGNDPVSSLVTMPPTGASLFYSSSVTVVLCHYLSRHRPFFLSLFLDDPPSHGLAFLLTSFLGL